MYKLYLYEISTDGGKTFTNQWLTENEAKEAMRKGLTVKKSDPKLHTKVIY